MKILLFTVLLLNLYIQHAHSQTWYFLRYWTPSDAVQFTSFSGTMVVPSLPTAGTYYLWPGLQDIGTTGVFQSVLDGRSGTWWIGDGWCCSNPSLSWGSGFNAYQGDVVQFTYSRDAADGNWDTTLTLNGDASSRVTGAFPLAYKSFDQVLFAIELYGVTWDFGPLVFENVSVSTNSSNTSWCTSAPENYNSATNYTLEGVAATVDAAAGTMTCEIAKLHLFTPTLDCHPFRKQTSVSRLTTTRFPVPSRAILPQNQYKMPLPTKSPSPPPSAPVALTPGPRATAFNNLYAQTLKHTLKAVSLENFASCFPTIARNAPDQLRMMHRGMVERLEQFAKEEFDDILRDRRVVEGLNSLEDLVADARRRKSRAVDGEGMGVGEVVPPHLLPASAIAKAHLAPHYASQQSQLNARLQTTQSQNATLALQIKEQRREIESLVEGIERAFRDLVGANELLGKESEGLAREAMAAEVEMGGV
ncbi:hypothetical protein B7494_g6777 [Chlorociboria aeruginascens]|nr:hypothetical protein B7494_g6777 [Chlorociboria aeruginascens]